MPTLRITSSVLLSLTFSLLGALLTRAPDKSCDLEVKVSSGGLHWRCYQEDEACSICDVNGECKEDEDESQVPILQYSCVCRSEGGDRHDTCYAKIIVDAAGQKELECVDNQEGSMICNCEPMFNMGQPHECTQSGPHVFYARPCWCENGKENQDNHGAGS